MNEINKKLYNTLNHYYNTEPQEVYERIYNEIKTAIIDLIVRGVLKDNSKDFGLIETLRAFHPNNIK